MKNVYFFQCQEAFGESIYLPYSAGVLWTYLKQFSEITKNYQLKKTFIDKIEFGKRIEQVKEPDLCLFSNYGWNTRYHLELAKKIKEKFPNTVIVVGGPNSIQEEYYLRQHSYVDLWTWGEGEETLKEILLGWALEEIHGLAWIDQQGLYHKTPIRQRRQALDEIPSPYLDGFFDEFFLEYDYNFLPIWETDRGCPYHCTFCDQGSEYFNKLFQFDIERLYKEIEWFAEKKIEYVELTASNFGIFERDLDIVNYLRNVYEKTGYPQKINATWAKNSPDRVFKMNKILDRINRGGVTLALQSSNFRALENIKRFNIVNEKLEKITNKYITSGILTYHDFILGLPGETLDSWKQGLLYVIDINPEGWIFGHAMEAFENTEFKNANYIKKHKIEFVNTPQVSFYNYKKPDIPVEYGDYVVSSYSMTKEDYLEGFLFKWFIITFHCLGWAKSIARQVSKSENIKASQFFLILWDWIKTNPGLIYREYNIVRESVSDVLEKGNYWGRQVHGQDDFYWEYETSSCCFIEKERVTFYLEMKKFLIEKFSNVDAEKIIYLADLNQISYSRTYPYVVDNYLVQAENYESWEEFCKQVYWWGKKRQSWKAKVNKING